MEQYVIIAHDGTDADAPARRMTARPAHLAVVRRLKAEGKFIEGGAILDEEGTMVGSVVMVAFPSRAELDEWLAIDPYVTGGVWQRLEVQPFRCVQLGVATPEE